MYLDEDLIQLSALQHFVFCPRQCALIHIEQVWSENLYTAEGRLLHEKVDTAEHESRGDLRVDYGVPLRSLHLGIVGKADVVEFHRIDSALWQPYPVEYKRGKPKVDHCDKVQLCAQAMCLEEMLNTLVSEGAIFYGKMRRRLVVPFDKAIRNETEETAKAVHDFLNLGITPKAAFSKKCENCSLVELCMPKAYGKYKSVNTYLLEFAEIK